MDLGQLFTQANQIGDKYLSDEEKAERDKELKEVQDQIRAKVDDSDIWESPGYEVIS